MKILIVAQRVDFSRNLDSVMRELCGRGHEIVFLHGTRSDMWPGRLKAAPTSRVSEDIAGVSSGYRPEPDEPWQMRLRVGRQVINRGVYMRRRHPSPERVVAGLERNLPDDLRLKIRTPVWRLALGTRAALRLWRLIEAASPASETLLRLLRDVDPDLMVVSPAIGHEDPVEADYLHAARTLGIPTLGLINGWNDLTSKGTLHLVPDLCVVWNEAMAVEAVEIHDVPADVVRISGAPHLDAVFSTRPRKDRAGMWTSMGCRGPGHDRPYVLFLCSSRAVWENETHLVTSVAAALRREFGDEGPALVVRPHSSNVAAFDDYRHPRVVVYPRGAEHTDPSESWQDYVDQLANALCVVGLNTTAFLDAAVADRPCLTIVSDVYWPAQGRTGHFRHLLKGDFLTICSSASEVAGNVRRVLDGLDDRSEGRRGFARWFLRPCGLDTPAGHVVADIIESAARPRAGVTAIHREGRPLVPGLTLAWEGTTGRRPGRDGFGR